MELPEGMRHVDCHLTWLHDILSRNFEDPESRTEYVQKLLNKSISPFDLPDDCDNEEGMGERFGKLEEECHPQNSVYVDVFARRLNNATMSIYCGDYQGALEQLMECQGLLDELSGECADRIGVVGYFVEALQGFIILMTGSTPPSEDAWIAADLAVTRNRFQDDKFTAVMFYLEGSLRRLFPGYGHEMHMENLQRVIQLDPDYHIWYLAAYQALRDKRRVFNRKKNLETLQVNERRGENFIKAPCSQEIEFCQTAYDKERNVRTTFKLALMKMDCLWMTVFQRTVSKKIHVETCPFDFDQTRVECLDLFDDAIRLAKEYGLKEWVSKSVVRKAEAVCHFGSTVTERREGVRLLEGLINEQPDNAHYRQKLALIYRKGVVGERGKIFLVNKPKALEHLRAALDLCQRNYFTCLKHYMKLFEILGSPLPVLEALNYLERSLTMTSSRPLLTKIRGWRGCIHWIYNPHEKSDGGNRRDACNDWLHALEHFPEMKPSLLKMIWKPPFSVYLNKRTSAKICKDELKRELEKVKQEKEVSAGILEAADVMLAEIEAKRRN